MSRRPFRVQMARLSLQASQDDTFAARHNVDDRGL
jgi:hypothetical protein